MKPMTIRVVDAKGEMMKNKLSVFFLAVVMAACGADVGVGTLEVTLSGEDGAKEGFPVEEDGTTIAFADGWSLEFTKYLVSIGNLSVTATDGEAGVTSSEVFVADVSKGDPTLATFTELPARRWDRVSFELLAPTADAKRLGDVSADDVERMTQGGFNYWLEGEATRGDSTVTFAWGFAAETKNADCTNGDDGTSGVVVKPNSKTNAEVTLHVEHLFWDALGSENAVLRFDAIAGVADENGRVSMEALAGQSLAQPLDADGFAIKDDQGKPVVYDAGSTTLSENNLRGFMTASIASQAHLNGEGLCTVSRR